MTGGALSPPLRTRLAGGSWSRWAKPLALAFVVLAVAMTIAGILWFDWLYWWTRDLDWYVDATRRLLTEGTWYLDRQLHGPYELQGGDVLYPPVSAILFAPWLVLPGWSFIAIPVAITAWAVRRLRPAAWVWPLMALCLLSPQTLGKVMAANPTLWAMAAVSLGTLYGWPAAFAVVKPTLVPFAVFGIRSRRWWLVIAGLAIASLPVLGLTLLYPQVVLDARGGALYYSIWDLPLMLIPVIAWLGRSREPTPAETPAGTPPPAGTLPPAGSPDR